MLAIRYTTSQIDRELIELEQGDDISKDTSDDWFDFYDDAPLINISATRLSALNFSLFATIALFNQF